MKIYDGQLWSVAFNNTTRVAYFLIGTAGAITFYLLDLMILARGIVAATTLFIIHETLQLRIEHIADFVIEKSIITKGDDDALRLLGVVIVDFLIVTPLFSPKDYVWPYTVVLITDFTFLVLLYITYALPARYNSKSPAGSQRLVLVQMDLSNSGPRRSNFCLSKQI